MKKLIVALSVGALMMGTSAMADQANSENENSAIVVNKNTVVGTCRTIPSIGYDVQLFTQEVHLVLTSSDNSKLVCHFDIPEGEEPKKVFKNSGFECGYWIPGTGTPGTHVVTTDSKFIATPGGQAKLECSFKGVQLDEI